MHAPVKQPSVRAMLRCVAKFCLLCPDCIYIYIKGQHEEKIHGELRVAH